MTNIDPFFLTRLSCLGLALCFAGACDDKDDGDSETDATTMDASVTTDPAATTGANTGDTMAMTAGTATGGGTATATAGGTGTMDGGSTTGDVGPQIGLTVANGATGTPIMGLTVCQHAAVPENCTSTDANGLALLPHDPALDFVFAISGPGVRTHLFPVRGGLDRNQHVTRVLPDAILALALAGSQVTEDPTKGIVASVVTNGFVDEGGIPLSMASASLTPMSGVGPIYSNDGGTPDLTLTATSNLGAYMFANVDPGEYDLAVTHPSATCTPSVGAAGATPNSTRVPVVAGAVTTASSMHCK